MHIPVGTDPFSIQIYFTEAIYPGKPEQDSFSVRKGFRPESSAVDPIPFFDPTVFFICLVIGHAPDCAVPAQRRMDILRDSCRQPSFRREGRGEYFCQV